MHLKAGDKIAIVATARKVQLEEIAAGLELLKSWGFEPVYGKHLFAVNNQFAGTDAERAGDLQWAIDDPEIKAIVCARGGYGTLRMVDLVDFSSLQQTKKTICGYSDITVLHNHLLAKYGMASVHSTMPVNMAKNSAEALNSFRNVLTGEQNTYEIPAHTLNRNGEARGILFGGNLSLVYALNGSSSLPDAKGKILFLEDLDEYLYHIDRMMMNLKRSGILSGISGLIVGAFTGMKDNPVPFGKTAEEIIQEHVSEYNYPVCFGFPAGHIEDNRALVMGREIRISVEKICTIEQ